MPETHPRLVEKLNVILQLIVVYRPAAPTHRCDDALSAGHHLGIIFYDLGGHCARCTRP